MLITSLAETSMLDAIRRLANAGTQIHLRAVLRLGSGVEIPLVAYPVPGGYRIEVSAHPTHPEGFFPQLATSLGMVMLDEHGTRAGMVVPLPPVG